MFDTIQSLDIHLLEIIRNFFVIDAEWFRLLVLLIADSQPILFSLFLIGLWFYGVSLRSNGPKHVALDLFWHVLVAFAIYWIINQLLPVRPRPETVTSLPPLVNHLPDNSFPSGHALFWGASWWALHTFLRDKKTTWIFFLLGALTVLARVLAGIHYPGDILIGFLLGWGLMKLFIRLPHRDFYRNW
jgi:undecaprenyl-diphosphatase